MTDQLLSNTLSCTSLLLTLTIHLSSFSDRTIYTNNNDLSGFNSREERW